MILSGRLREGPQVLHALEGRLRIKANAIKGDSERAARYCRTIRSISGVRDAIANPVTGSVTVFYDASRCSEALLCAELVRVFGAIRLAPPSRAFKPTPLNMLAATGGHVARAALNAALEAAVKHAIARLI
jgi:hypothetical protein